MKKYFAFFRIRMIANLQYRSAAIAGIATQFVWGIFTILLFKAFYETAPQNFPMSFEATVSYIWLQQAFLAFFALWKFEPEIMDSIVTGAIAYKLVRPLGIYNVWFTQSLALRIGEGILRCIPVLCLSLLLPEPYKLVVPDFFIFILFLFSLTFGLLTAVALTVLIYVLCFFTVSPKGLRTFFISFSEIMVGRVIPIPFFPKSIQPIFEFSPFTGVQNIPLRIFSGDINGTNIYIKIAVQISWLIILILVGKIIANYAQKKVIVNGG